MVQLPAILRGLTCSTLMNLNAAAKNLIRLSRAQRKADFSPREEGWECEMEKKDQFAMRPWGLRSQFNSFLALFLALIIILSIFITTKDGGGILRPVFKSSAEDCDLFSGRWVYDNSTYPLYSEKGCKFMSDQSACEKFGRTNLKHQNWRWQPHGCNLPRYVQETRNSRVLISESNYVVKYTYVFKSTCKGSSLKSVDIRIQLLKRLVFTVFFFGYDDVGIQNFLRNVELRFLVLK